jgi:cyclic beta-1,2-glucan synthetase
MVTNNGGGYSHWNDLAVTRWREDTTCDNWGTFCYLRDLTSGYLWSSAFQPTLQHADTCEAHFSAGRATFRRSVREIETLTEITVSPHDDVELRRVSITNRSSALKTFDAVSYSEIVLAQAATDSAHPAFSKLFVETEIVLEYHVILSHRRPRAPDEATPWMVHLLVTHLPTEGDISYETDRMRFIGRGRTSADPQAMDSDTALSGSAGPVLDPVAAIGCRFALGPGEIAVLDWIMGIAETREACMMLVRRYQDRQCADRLFSSAPIYNQSVCDKLRIAEADASLYAQLAGAILYPSVIHRADANILEKNQQGQSGLWAYAISGDLPIVLLRTSDAANTEVARQLIQACTYWRLHGLAVDLVIICQGRAAHRAALQEQITQLAAVDAGQDARGGGVFVLNADQVDEAGLTLLQAVARIILNGQDGSLAQQFGCEIPAACPAPTSTPTTTPSAVSSPRAARGLQVSGDRAAVIEPPPPELIFHNGLGGFTPDGCEYVISSARGQMTPVPWVNVLANPTFGTLISESGSAHTWSENAHEFRLTPWSNDPVGDGNTEAYYLRDEESGHVWSPTLLPAGGTSPYVTRHGFGYSVFEHSEHGIDSELCVYVAIDAPLKFARLTLSNRSGRARRLSATGYLEWVLGDEGSKTRLHVITSVDADGGALFARNAYNTDFSGRTAFFDVDAMVDEVAAQSISGNRESFLGRNGTVRNPAAMTQRRLDGIVGAALDPCAAIRVPFDLAAGQTREIVFRLGAGESLQAARELVQRWRGATAAHQAFITVKQYWQEMLGKVQVTTPDRSLDVLTNGWLLYQVMACRLWGRTAFYQASGAFGFRDQLQDVMSLVHAAPELVREHLLHCASHQFPEGDVQHWWHPPSGRGVRTHCSDDYLWLPLVTCRYVQTTGDTGVLEELVHFAEGSALKASDESLYELPGQSEQQTSLYDHCVRAIERGLRFGAHGLPLMGSGDWNDGMNLVGAGGKGESVWLGFFLCTVLTKFSAIALRHNDPSFSERCLSESARLRAAIEQHGWDGDWYRRAWFDDGSPLGSAENPECRIDSIPQSWSVLSGAGDARRTRHAMNAVDRELVRHDSGLIQLLAPPFDLFEPSPGYIKGYPRGVRENGGQYTHAAVWAAMAYAALGDTERAWQLFRMLNPISHSTSTDAIAIYKVEPYVMASDVYAVAPHVGRGGWTWYTGAAGWMVQFILESLLGLRREAEQLHIVPCVPDGWKSFEVIYRYRQTAYHITVFPHAAESKARLTIDGFEHPGPGIPLVDDRQSHFVELRV